MTKETKICLILLRIKWDPNQTSVFQICKFVEVGFGIWDGISLLRETTTEGFTTASERNQMKIYQISSKGETFVKVHLETGKKELTSDFPDRKEIIDSLFQISH